jgi:hypothetical protein
MRLPRGTVREFARTEGGACTVLKTRNLDPSAPFPIRLLSGQPSPGSRVKALNQLIISLSDSRPAFDTAISREARLFARSEQDDSHAYDRTCYCLVHAPRPDGPLLPARAPRPVTGHQGRGAEQTSATPARHFLYDAVLYARFQAQISIDGPGVRESLSLSARHPR